MDENQPLLKKSESKSNGTITPADDSLEPNHNHETNSNVKNNDKLTKWEKFSYGLGHVYNDLCAAMWFSYSLLFLQAVLELESTTAGSMMLLGQIMDAIATPIVGIVADRWGSKRIWHLIGTILVLFTFPLIFSRCLGCWMSDAGTYLRWWQPFYYAIVITIFQSGWAIVQISHLAMIPILTQNPNERSELTAIRYTASVCSGVTVYVITWLILHIESNNEMEIGRADDYKFRNISLMLTFIGIILSLIFHFGLRGKINLKNNTLIEINQIDENNQVNIKKPDTISENVQVNEADKTIENRGKFTKKNFLLSPLLYQVTFLYVASRLFSSLGLIYMPLYLDERLLSPESNETIEAIASVPLATYISSFFTSILLKYRNEYFNNNLLYLFGSILSVATCIWIREFLTPSSGSFQLYIVAAMLGAGGSVTMVTSLCITADMIGSHSNQSGVVYSIVTFADKLITGIAVVIIENNKCENVLDCPEYYRGILAYVCGGSALLGALTMLVSLLVELKTKNVAPKS